MITSIATAEHYIWGENCEGWHLVKTPALSIIQERMPPNTSEQLHYHELAQQFFFILEGTATFVVNGQTLMVPAQHGLHILPGQVHQIINQTDTDLLFTVTSQPTSRGDRVEVN
ncbi:cupin domain-containing protein [Adhaeribacter swui]|uniref:Cupin domain-containing protein n=1 Tax=Adhaeribacter swui TaxID=2086471 RepID=A0A7G7G7A1_9BACT|nr:cupin domain-containing protein [Adhaeribacter swui]QNF33035.1 cupin domain-containing protein [Adhaeribacter swui]